MLGSIPGADIQRSKNLQISSLCTLQRQCRAAISLHPTVFAENTVFFQMWIVCSGIACVSAKSCTDINCSLLSNLRNLQQIRMIQQIFMEGQSSAERNAFASAVAVASGPSNLVLLDLVLTRLGFLFYLKYKSSFSTESLVPQSFKLSFCHHCVHVKYIVIRLCGILKTVPKQTTPCAM